MGDCSALHTSNSGNPIAIRTRLIYLLLGFEVRPKFQRLPKIQPEAV
jgi:hypothetical protein